VEAPAIGDVFYASAAVRGEPIVDAWLRQKGSSEERGRYRPHGTAPRPAPVHVSTGLGVISAGFALAGLEPIAAGFWDRFGPMLSVPSAPGSRFKEVPIRAGT
jgi:hypothetical protein